MSQPPGTPPVLPSSQSPQQQQQQEQRQSSHSAPKSRITGGGTGHDPPSQAHDVDPLSSSARNPKLIGRKPPPYSSATQAALQMARSSVLGPHTVKSNSICQLGGPGPLGSPLAKLMKKCVGLAACSGADLGFRVFLCILCICNMANMAVQKVCFVCKRKHARTYTYTHACTHALAPPMGFAAEHTDLLHALLL